MHNTLELDGVILDFDTNRVLQDIYLKSETGKITGLLGRNGTGKSCIMNIIFGELSPSDKSVRLNGKTLYDSSRNPEDMRYLTQFEFIPKWLSVKQVFRYFELDFEDFAFIFPDFEQFYFDKIRDLSGGERRIIEAYSILASKTKFCMLDEPFSQIMPIYVEAMKQLILREKANKGILVTDHLYKHIIDICDSIYVIDHGQTYLTKSVQDLEKHEYIRSISPQAV